MSQSQTPKQNFLQTLLLFGVIFLGFQLMCPRKEPDKRSVTELLKSVRKLHADFAATKTGGEDLVHSLTQESAELQSKLQAADTGEKLTPQQKADMLDETRVLVSDAQLKHGVREKNFNEIQMSYQMLHTQVGSLQSSPFWNKAYPIDPTDGFPRKSVSLKELYTDLESNAKTLAKNALVWGFMPGYQVIDGLVHATGAVPWFSYAFAALFLALLVRGIVWPLAQKQYMWSRQMSQLQPLIKELKAKYQGQDLNMKMMELYKQYGINPMAGCGPALLQMPLFFLVYQCMLMYRFEFRNGTFLWVSDAGHNALPGLVAPNLGERDYILLVFYGVSMIVTQLLTPVSDPSNVRQQRIMGLGITIVFTLVMFTPIFPVPSAFVLYWIFTNLIATFQMMRAYRLPLPPLVKVSTVPGGVLPAATKAGAPPPEVKISGNGQKATGAPKLHKPKKRKK